MKKLTTGVAAGALLLALAGCGSLAPVAAPSSAGHSAGTDKSTPKPAATETVKEACVIVGAGIEASGADLDQAASSTDFGEVVGIVEKLRAAMETAKGKITNDEVTAAVSTYIESITALSDLHVEIQAANNDQGKLAALNPRLAEVLAGISTSGAAFESLCP